MDGSDTIARPAPHTDLARDSQYGPLGVFAPYWEGGGSAKAVPKTSPAHRPGRNYNGDRPNPVAIFAKGGARGSSTSGTTRKGRPRVKQNAELPRYIHFPDVAYSSASNSTAAPNRPNRGIWYSGCDVGYRTPKDARNRISRTSCVAMYNGAKN